MSNCGFDVDSIEINEKLPQSSIQFSNSLNIKLKQRKLQFLSNVKIVRNLSNHSIRDFGKTDRVNSTIVAGYNVTNLIQGIGILGVPYAIAKGSWIGLFLLFATAFVASSTGKMIVECLYNNQNLPGASRIYKTYSCLGEAVWPKFGNVLVTVISIAEMFGGTTLYIILLSVESQRFFSKFMDYVDINYCCLVLAYMCLPLLFVTRMSIISWFSFIAVIGLLCTNVSLIAFCIYNYNNISINNFPEISWSSVPLSMGIITFSYCAHAAFPGIEASMKKPESFNKMMNVSFIVAASIKFVMSFMFNLIYGINTLQQCTLNVDNHQFSMAIEIFVILNTFFSLPLTMFIISERIDEILQFRFHSSMWPGGSLNWYWLLLSRGFILTLSIFTAMIVPHFALLMGLIGSITGSCLTFIFPCLISLKLKSLELSLSEKIYRIVIVILGIIFGISGAVVSLIDIINIIKL